MAVTRFYLDYIAQWPTVLALLPLVCIFAGWAGHALAKRILAGRPAAGLEWVLIISVAAYVMRRWA